MRDWLRTHGGYTPDEPYEPNTLLRAAEALVVAGLLPASE